MSTNGERINEWGGELFVYSLGHSLTQEPLRIFEEIKSADAEGVLWWLADLIMLTQGDMSSRG